MMTFGKSPKRITDKITSQTVRVPIRKRTRRVAALVCALLAAFLFLRAPVAHAHDVTPSATDIWLVVDQDFSLDITNTIECTAEMSAVSGNTSILEPNSTSPVTALDATFSFTAKIVGDTTVTYGWSGVDPCTDRITGLTKNIHVIDPQPYSCMNAPAQGTDGHPVSTFNGELFSHEPPDINLGGPLPLYFKRYYASYLRRSFVMGDLGDNWRHNFEWVVHWIGNNLMLIDDVGRVVRYLSDGAGNWTQQNNLHLPYKILQDAQNEIDLYNTETGLFYHFDGFGRLTRLQDANGNTHTLTYNSWTGKLYEVTDGIGRTLRFYYNTVGTLLKLATVQERQGATTMRSVLFTYDAAGDNMLRFYDVNGKRTTYTYAAPDGADRGLMLSEQLPEGNIPYTQTYFTVADGANSGKVKTQTDAYGNVQTFSYSGNSTTMTDPNSDTRMHVHTAGGSLSSITDKSGSTASLGSDSTGRRSSVTDKVGGTTSYSYDSTSGRLSSIGHADGNTTGYTYTSRTVNGFTQRDLTRVDYPDGTSETYSYDAAGNLLSRTDRAGSVTTHTYNGSGQVLQTTTPLGGTTQYTYNSDGTLEFITDNSLNQTDFAYDSMRRIITVIPEDGNYRSYTYNNMDQPLTVNYDERSNPAYFTYDDNGNMVAIRNPGDSTTTFSYDLMDRLVSVTAPLGNTATRTYDTLGRPATFTDAGGNEITMGYDLRGRMTSLTDASGNVWNQGFDDESIISSVTDPLSNNTSFTSDSMGRITSISTPQGRTSSFTYDSMGRVTAVTDPLGNTTSKTYDSRGLTSSVTLPGGAITASYTRNDIGQMTTVDDPNGNGWLREYDTGGRLTSVTDPLGRTQTITYDTRNRLSTVTYPGGLGSVTMSYDAVGNLNGHTFSDGTTTSYTYDANNRRIAATGITRAYDANGRISSSNGIAITRDLNGNIKSMTLAPDKVVTYAYDANDQLTTVTDWAGGVTGFTYDNAGRLTNITRPNSVNTTSTWDNDSRLTGIAESGVSSITLTRDANGQITSATRSVPEAASSTTLSSSNTFDAAAQIVGATYDTVGRMTGNGTDTFSWNLASLLTGYTVDGTTVSATYDAESRRASRTTGGVTRDYVWNDALGLNSISVEAQGGVDLKYYIHTPGGALLYSIDATTDARNIYHYDEMGNTIFVTNDAGAVIGSYAYSPYGQVIASTGSLDNPFTWQGQYGLMDEGNGMYYVRARYYDADTGRFISRDPVKSTAPKEINPYQYALNNPLQFIDPLGKEGKDITLTEAFMMFYGYYRKDRAKDNIQETDADECPQNNYYDHLDEYYEEQELSDNFFDDYDDYYAAYYDEYGNPYDNTTEPQNYNETVGAKPPTGNSTCGYGACDDDYGAYDYGACDNADLFIDDSSLHTDMNNNNIDDDKEVWAPGLEFYLHIFSGLEEYFEGTDEEWDAANQAPPVVPLPESVVPYLAPIVVLC